MKPEDEKAFNEQYDAWIQAAPTSIRPILEEQRKTCLEAVDHAAKIMDGPPFGGIIYRGPIPYFSRDEEGNIVLKWMIVE